ncbi:hypothetical protein Ddye_026404 [Dipteronia dyeriana]|uniref:F-box domain-containing protein n=1 Tax=Dipteronia dyeriana TaxID=168575 RepID=A0AAD9WP56_9ROSI|nr:hypothetical protein Ddye_026404 [Dipteronia dyeriana]
MALTLANTKIRSSGYDGDRLSSLPEHLICHILSFLETIDVIRAGSVCRKWRYFWVEMPYLNFNVDTIWSHPELRWSMETINGKFKDFVNWVLMSQDCSVHIQRFRLKYTNYGGDYTFCRWMNVLAQRKVQRLDLKLLSETPMELPRCIVNCESLVDLKIYFDLYCVLKLPEFPGFTGLKSLYLCKVEFSDPVVLAKFVSSCPVLESLIMHSCVFSDFKILDITAPRLRNLTINVLAFHGDGLNCEVVIACPSLVSFDLLGSPSWLSFKDTNSLQNVLLYFDSDLSDIATFEESRNLLNSILKGIRNIEVLKLSPAFLEFLLLAVPKPECFSASFCNLKSLMLYVTMDEYDQSIIHLLNRAPNLEALSVFFEWWEGWSDNWKMPNKDIPCLRDHLREVELIDIVGNNNELELIKFILKNGHVLQNMNIYWGKELENPSKIISEVMKFPRSSSDVVLTFFEPQSDIFFRQCRGKIV